MEKTKIKKIGNTVLNVVLYIFLALCLLALLITLVSKKGNDDAVEVFGYQMRIVTSDSMAKNEFTDVSAYKIKDIPIRSMVFIQTVPDDEAKAEEWYRSLAVGDVLTFRYVYTSQVTITHRITSITEKSTGGFIIELEGDNKSSEDGAMVQIIDTSIPNNMNYVIGKVTARALVFGVIMSFLSQPVGMILMVILPCSIIMLLEILKIVRLLTADKKKKEKEESEKKDNELEELRRRLAELENAKNGDQQETKKEEPVE